ncbi:hypothetical protein EXN48_18580 [Clostridium botulinum]|uniref:Uncharacterized protein n=1 Tax=Clostridium botulinum (strain Hall / ATCC 3502 / NCTC 13319 / Type A) TaxID=441771 RepID=A5I188_CLOBH|nr:hypothetical protein RSJ15_06640 [Clostridium botulinum]CAL82800.1 hypothetical protein CBO1249 [Clostridium botulinum A str. ATCC 3502]AUN10195.1 hypothetical protein RSJ6_06650 [Clostridium botulinum]AUN25023.1 hypothetical protein RSJ21_07095 [Clostridium botulinum]AWB17164.1 hypothetical protein DB732_06720 [Clostridium botulinum]
MMRNKKIKPSRRLDLFQVAKSVLRYTTFLAYSRGMKKLCILGALIQMLIFDLQIN